MPKHESPPTIEKPKTHTKSLKQVDPKLECTWGTYGNKDKPNQTTHRRARNEGPRKTNFNSNKLTSKIKINFFLLSSSPNSHKSH